MSQLYWQVKIWGLLHDSALKALHDNSDRSQEGVWNVLGCMEGWISPQAKSLTDATLSTQWLKHVGLCDLISASSDRAAVGRLPNTAAINYDTTGLEIRHLLSGKPSQLKLGQWHDRITNSSDRTKFLQWVETACIPEEIKTCTDARKVFWWFWRCYPQALSQALNRSEGIPEEPCLHLLPAETRLPDASLWSHTSMTSALAGGLAGYYEDSQYPSKGARKGKTYHESRPHVATFTLTPVQELIKASRKMRDFWAGSWLLHYLSAKICWGLAWKYGPDILLYPCLYEQPLIDHWLLAKYPDFQQWIKTPPTQKLLTAGFPNVLVMILPDNGASQTDTPVKNPVEAAMSYAKQILSDEWQSLGKEVLNDLQGNNEKWIPNLNINSWHTWLKAQWQSYWVALPIGDTQTELHHSPRQQEAYDRWLQQQNQFASPKPNLFVDSESNFLKATYEAALKEDYRDRHSSTFKARKPNLNVGSWWASIFDQTRFTLNAVKNARNWQLPTAFGSRSSISGIGPVVHGGDDWSTESEVDRLWNKTAGIFDGVEKLNATEVLKRSLHRVLPQILFDDASQSDKNPLHYPDLSSGVAGWWRQMQQEDNQPAMTYFIETCDEICAEFPWTHRHKDAPAKLPWGIPWIAEHHSDLANPRLLNAGWLIDDFEPSNPTNQPFTDSQQKEAKKQELKRLREFIQKRFSPGNNPTDWYVLAAGDGDSMSEWLKGVNLQAYKEYIPTTLLSKIAQMPQELHDPFKNFLEERKRMGPATHSALSRALLDFSNQLVPYLTEERYAGRLIYGGGDDVLAYTNLWEWDKWLWDIRQCFRGDQDPRGEFESTGDYWHPPTQEGSQWKSVQRPLFTMGSLATISFGVTIAHHSVPLAIALENLWEAEKEAKAHKSPDAKMKDAVQMRVLYGNGNILKATVKFDVFHQWQHLINTHSNIESALFEQAAQLWLQHPAPKGAIAVWTKAFCDRRDVFSDDEDTKLKFQENLAQFLTCLWDTTLDKDADREVQNWLKLAAFTLRNRNIKLGEIG